VSARPEKQRLFANTIATTVAQFGALGLAFVLAPLLIRSFGEAGYGAYVLATAVAAFLLLLDFGLGPAVEKLLAEHLATGRSAEAGTMLSTVLVAYAGIGVLVAGVNLALAATAGHVFHLGAEVALLRQLLTVAAITAVAWWPLSLGARALGGLQRYTHTAAVSGAMAAANAAAAVWVVSAHRGPLALAIANAGISLVAGLVQLALARGMLARHGLALTAPRRDALRPVLAFSGPIFTLQLAVQVLYHNTDRLLLGMFVGSAAVTLYEGPARLVALLIQITGFGNSALIPFASQLEATRRSDTLEALLLRGSRYVAAIVAPIAVTLAVLARPLLVGWLGPAFAASERPTVLLTSVQALVACLTVGHTIVVATGKLPGRLPVILGIVGLNLVLSLLWVRPYGMTGVALGTVVATVIDYPFHLRYLARHVGLRAGPFLREVVLPVYPLLLLPAALAWAARVGGLTSSLAGTLLTFVMAVLLYWMAFLVLMVGRAERDGLIATARALVAARRGGSVGAGGVEP
jgi:O-antigen/teichoic acid export membrane protein